MATNLVIDAKLSKWVYSDTLNNSSASLNIDGWQPVKLGDFRQTSANFAAQLFVGPDGTYKIAYRGTASLLSRGDTTTNGQSIVLGRWTQELTDGVKFAYAAIKQIQLDHPGLSFDQARALLSVTGHSQGGFESEVVAKFFGLKGTSLDGPGAGAITQTQDFANLKSQYQTSEPQLQSDYPIGEFVARRYTFIVGALNNHVNGVATDNSIVSLTVSAQTTLLNPLVGVGVQAQFLHKIDNIIEMETLRATSRFWQILGVGETTDSVVAQIGGYMYPTNTASTGDNVPLVTPDPAVMEQITNFLANEAGPSAAVYVRDGATYIEGNGTSLLIRKDGSGERWITSGDMVAQEILGSGSIVTNCVETRIVDNQTITETSRYSPLGLVLERRIVQTLNSDETVTREVFNGANELVVTSTAEELGDGSVLFTDVYPDGTVVTRVEDALLETATQPENGAQTLYNAIATYGPSIIDALSLIKAIQSGEPLPVLASGLRLANDLTILNGASNLNLSGAANTASGILSLMSLDAALERGDTLGAVTAGAQALAFGAQAFADFAASQAFAAISEGTIDLAAETLALQSQALANTVGKVLPFLSIANSLAHGDMVGAAVGVVSYFVPVVGWAYAVFSIIDSLFNSEEIPDPWGTGSFTWNGTGISYQSAGETGGNEAVANVMTSVLATMNALIERERQQNPGSQLGIIPNRMPGVGYDMSGYRYTDIDPLSGAEQHPSLRFDTSGNPYNADPGSPESYQSIIEGMVYSALSRQAIAPLWEVLTARAQTDAGDPKAGLTEEERAGRDGQLAAPLTGSTQTFRPVVLDMDGDGIETVGKDVSGVAFDVDDSGFLKATGWATGGDAFLTLDRDYNGETNSGREMFSNSVVDISRRGLAGMAWVNANCRDWLTVAANNNYRRIAA